MLLKLASCAAVLFLVPLAGFAAEPALSTVAERSGWKKTGRYAEVQELCRGFEEAFPGKARCSTFGTTPEGRPLLALAASLDGTLTPALARKRSRTVALLQGGIHAGEIDGKDAGFLLLRDMLQGQSPLLSQVTVVFVPVFNVDGHERFGPHNRPNQNGPEESGWRTTAANLNLNRDYMKADAPEMRAMLGLLADWDPIMYVDAHVTDGADFRHDVSVMIEPTLEGPQALKRLGLYLRNELMLHLVAQGHVPLWFYPAFEQGDDPMSGVRLGVAPPRYSQAYWSLRDRIGVLIETHSWKDYATRVKATRDVFLDLLEVAAREGGNWRVAAETSDREDAELAGREVALDYETTGSSRAFEFQGWTYERVPSEVSSQTWTIYHAGSPTVWRIPLYDALRPSAAATAPKGGYLIPPAYVAELAPRLKLHGVSYRVLKTPPDLAPGELTVFRATDVVHKDVFEGRSPVQVKGAWRAEERPVPAGSLYVPIAQPRARLVMGLFEPGAPDAFLDWGFFNAAFERKEYMESYVAEKVAREMMERDPALKAEFESKLKEEPELAASPGRRLDFFYRRHPSWDERLDLYPVYRVEKPL